VTRGKPPPARSSHGPRQLRPVTGEGGMSFGVSTINLGGVNCYLAKCTDGFVLIDTGFSTKRDFLVRQLEKAGCRPGNLKLILITHGDSDHAGNGAFLRRTYGAKVGMHPLDVGMVERGDMGWNRKAKPDRMSLLFRLMGVVVSVVAKRHKFETFSPDIEVRDGFPLSIYGFNARVVHIPGHSKGSIGVLTEDGKLYCGDFLYNMPGMNHVDDMNDRNASLEKLKKLEITAVYPGHGKPIPGLWLK
jgi:hydroxyacylglutathione hydrolase